MGLQLLSPERRYRLYMVDFSKASVESRKPVDKTIYTLEGQFTYSYTTADMGGAYTVPNPEPGVIFLPDSIFSTDGGVTWFGDLDRNIEPGNDIPDINTIVSVDSIIYRWASYNVPGSLTVLFRTKLLAVN